MTEEWILSGKEPGVHYRVQIFIPDHPPQSEEGYPLIYMMDGNYYFGLGADVIRNQSHKVLKTGVDPAIVVGISLDAEESVIRERRFYDFTPPASVYKFPDKMKWKTTGKHGGAEIFLDWLIDELQPKILENYQVQQNKQCLYGHSLSGLFALYSMFKRPEAFQCYLAISPSIWWNEKHIYSFLKDAKDSKLFIAVGEEEGFMVEDSLALYHRLPSAMDEKTAYYVADDENHASVVPATLSRAFRYFFS
ncbi:alpha/beta hydrolase [Terribacillus saccharophilus]|uniref:alpha/beta hydrolase n=1 Tax=Terribacillus saccharophilus TaxID=361277 RepID=UPI002DD2BA14|nr:alpha/beta hydrolase-fold protein [Terribacillus saccharophilus]